MCRDIDILDVKSDNNQVSGIFEYPSQNSQTDAHIIHTKMSRYEKLLGTIKLIED
jgi:hypothetical protein